MITLRDIRVRRKLRRATIPVGLTALLTFSTICVGENKGTLAEEVARELKEQLPKMLSHASIPGAAVAVVDDRNIVWEHAYGHVDGQESRLVDLATLFSIQSMTKNFTALAVLMAVQDGVLDLDTPIKKYLPDFTVNSIYDEHPEEIITLRLLLMHRAGLTHEAPFGSNYDDRNDFTRHIESISSTWLRYPVGYRKAYSNLGIDLAGYILQVRSGKPFELYVKEKVLDPIGMTDSLLEMDIIEKQENRAIGHARDRKMIRLRIPMIPAGGVYTNVRDMVKYLQFHVNKGVVNGRRILRADLMEQMHTIQFPYPGQRSGWGLGMVRDPVSDSYHLYMAGGGYGFSSFMAIYPEKNLGLVFLSNLENHKVTCFQVRYYVVQRILERRFGIQPVDKAGTGQMTKLETNDWRVQAVLGRYGGEHALVIGYQDNILGLRYPSGDFYPLRFYNDGAKLVGMYGSFSEIRFLPPFNGRRGPLTTIDRRASNHFGHLYDFNDSPSDPSGPDKPHWPEYVGEYGVLRYGAPSETVGVSIRNGYLYFGESKCREHEPGLFFTFDGEALDLRSDPPIIRNLILRKKDVRPK